MNGTTGIDPLNFPFLDTIHDVYCEDKIVGCDAPHLWGEDYIIINVIINVLIRKYRLELYIYKLVAPFPQIPRNCFTRSYVHKV